MKEIFFILMTSLNCLNANGAIDLGDLEIEGEIRRPMIQYISSKKSKRDSMYQFLKHEFNLSVSEILRSPVSLNHAVKRQQKERDQLIQELLD